MAGFLFDKIIFGPVLSRRLGISLGVNLLPIDYKICSFDCIYCECGWTKTSTFKQNDLPPRKIFFSELEKKLKIMMSKDEGLDSITFAGNGEPTIHPDFSGIIDDTIQLRDTYFPDAKVTVLSNASTLQREKVFKSLFRIDNNILKLDAGTDTTYQKLNRPLDKSSLKEIVEKLKEFKGKLIVQTLFVRGNINGEYVDNTNELEITTWLNHLKEIQPESVMIYPYARGTAADNLEKIEAKELEKIAEKVRALGLEVMVY